MKACYKRIKSVMRPATGSTTGSKSSGPEESLVTPSKTSGQLRHAKCLSSRGHYGLRETYHPNVLRRSRRTFSPETVTIPPGSLTLAQIRSVPLSVRQIRGIQVQQQDRSSYVINAEQIRSRVPPPLHQLKRSRSLSPQILRTTGTTELKSPTLVRSVSNVGRGSNGHHSSRKQNPTSGSYTLRRSSLLRQRERSTGSPRLNGKTGPVSSSTRSTFIPVVKSPLAGKRTSTTAGTTHSPILLHSLKKKLERDGSPRGMIHEEDAGASMAEYQLQQRKKKIAEATPFRQDQNGSSKPPSKSRLFLQALVGGSMDSQSGSRALVPVPPGSQYPTRPRPPSTLPVMLPRQQVLPQPQHQPPPNLFRRQLTNSSSLFYDQTPKGPRGGFGRQPSGTPSSSTLFDDDPGIMSEAETSSTGFRRGGKCRSSLPVVRTPSKTLERPLGLVFLQYRSETKRALLPNEITSMDTVKALFVRSFPKQLTLEYLDVMNSKVYIHDVSKDMFYELEDLRDIRGNSVLRLFEPHVNGNGAVPGPGWDQDQSYFSEPEFDSDFQHQHIHKSKGNKSPYLAPYAYPVGATLPRGRPYSPLVAVPAKSVQTGPNSTLPPPKPQRNTVPAYGLVKRTPAGVVAPVPNMVYATSRGPINSAGQERSTSFPPSIGHYADGRARVGGDIYSSADTAGYISSPERYISEDPYYYPPPSRSGSVTPSVLIDEESRFRMEHMERQLANLTGLVQKALTPVPLAATPSSRIQAATLPRNVGATNYSLVQARDYIPSRDFRADDTDKLSSSSSASLPDERPPNPIDKVLAHPKFGKEKSVSFSDDPPDLSKVYSPAGLHPVEKPSKPAIKSSTLPRMSQVSDRLVAAPGASSSPHGKQTVAASQVPVTGNGYEKHYGNYAASSGRELSPEMYNQLRNLQKKAKELKSDVRILRRNVQAQAHTVRETLRDTFLRFKVVTLAGSDQWMAGGDREKVRLKREEDLYRQEMLKLDKDLTDLETTVEELRSHVINKRTRVNMSDVENMALVLSKSSKSVADLKARFPALQESMRGQLGAEMDRMVSEERFLKDEPDRLESSLRRCKKLTGTLVTLKRLASVQEQRLPSSTDSGRSLTSPSPSTPTDKVLNRNTGFNMSAATASPNSPATWFMVTPNSPAPTNAPENQLDALLDELNEQQPSAQRNRLNPPDPPKRLPSYPSTESGGSPVRHHPPLPPKPTKVPPPPPPRSSSKNSPLISPHLAAIDSDSTESLNSQDGRSGSEDKLSQRHQELLRKQKMLQDQYLRLQMLQDKKSVKGANGEGGSQGRLPQHSNQNNGSVGAASPVPSGESLANLNLSSETDIL